MAIFSVIQDKWGWIFKKLKPTDMSKPKTQSPKVYATRSGKLQVNDAVYFKSDKVKDTIKKLMASSIYLQINEAKEAK